MFTLQDLQWLDGILQTQVFHGTAEMVEPHFARFKSVKDKIDQLLADHPVDEEKKKPATKNPTKK